MINLLAPEVKQQIKAARTNVILLNYCFILSATIVVILGIFGVGTWLTIEQQQAANNHKDQATQAAKSYSQTRQAAESFAKDLQQAKNILANEVSFYNLITSLAAVVPSGVILNNLSLDTTTLTTPLTITGRANNYDSAVRLKNALSESSIFKDVKLTSITEIINNQDPLSTRYPINVTLSATFEPDFIKGGDAQ